MSQILDLIFTQQHKYHLHSFLPLLAVPTTQLAQVSGQQVAEAEACAAQNTTHREAHVCELFYQTVHDPGLILLARCLHALSK